MAFCTQLGKKLRFVGVALLLEDLGILRVLGGEKRFPLRVRAYAARGYECEGCGNLYALVLERCGHLISASGRQGFIVPVSSVSTDRYYPLQKYLTSYDLYFSNYDDRPSRLFDGLEHIRLTIHILGIRSNSPTIYATRYQKWFSEERPHLFGMLAYARSSLTLVPKSMAKFGSERDVEVAEHLAHQKTPLAKYFVRGGSGCVLYSRKVGYFLQVLNFTPKVLDGNGNERPPSEFKRITFTNSRLASLALACLNSNLFYWFVTVTSDCRHLNKREVEALPMHLEALASSPYSDQIIDTVVSLMDDLQERSVTRSMRFKHDTLRIQFIYPKKSKAIIDQLDRQLGSYLELSPKQVDYLVNYDAKFRMGAADDLAGEGE
ncbi:hypothetical protein [Mesorhizobium sp. dw_380]|uniref:hypothetical protein n=1 Tax=Mesorhizobium sp. dw_380 TaxID=2812001 RepID=UPI001BDF4112|nr:hypothetical protein [Mesorhizobium sp. dw_380]